MRCRTAQAEELDPQHQRQSGPEAKRRAGHDGQHDQHKQQPRQRQQCVCQSGQDAVGPAATRRRPGAQDQPAKPGGMGQPVKDRPAKVVIAKRRPRFSPRQRLHQRLRKGIARHGKWPDQGKDQHGGDQNAPRAACGMARGARDHHDVGHAALLGSMRCVTRSMRVLISTKLSPRHSAVPCTIGTSREKIACTSA